ncbi:MAG: hypothetical protein M3Y22_02170, partial [Pseudomonadota bacterium]|nr:hypothetical protein [Pseudomonadota bacterium]
TSQSRVLRWAGTLDGAHTTRCSLTCPEQAQGAMLGLTHAATVRSRAQTSQGERRERTRPRKLDDPSSPQCSCDSVEARRAATA